MKTKYNFITNGWLLLAVAVFSMAACNKPFNNELKGADNIKVVKERKVLLVLVDGGVGREVKQMAPPTLQGLTDFSMYSWDAISNYNPVPVNNQLSWSSMLTGVLPAKHGVTTDFTTNNFASYPTFFSRIKQAVPTARTSAFTSTQILADGLLADATVKANFENNDVAVKDATINELKNQNPVVVLSQFHGADIAGANGGYLATNTAYRDSVLKIDSYISEMLTALKTRPTYNKEDWLVIITSNKGSNAGGPFGATWSAFEDPSFNTFYFAYNPRFSIQSLQKPSRLPYTVASTFYNSKKAETKNAIPATNTQVGNFGATGGFTFQCKVKLEGIGYFETPLISKKSGWGNSTPGWISAIYGNSWDGYAEWHINVGQTTGDRRFASGAKLQAQTWYTFTTVVRQEGAARNLYMYIDGVLQPAPSGQNRDISGLGNLDNTEPFTVGRIPGFIPAYDGGYSPTLMVTDIRLYNTDLSDNYISNNYCRIDVDNNDPYRSNLIGFWPATDIGINSSNKRFFTDYLTGANPLIVTQFVAANYDAYTPKVCPPISIATYKSVPNAINVAPQIYQWIGVQTPLTWELDGVPMVPRYNDLGL